MNTEENYDFELPAGESNAQPDWKEPIEIQSGTFEATLRKAEVRVNAEKGQLSVLAEFAVQIPDEPDPVDHSEWLTTHRGGRASWSTVKTYERIAALVGTLPDGRPFDAERVKAAMIQSGHHEQFNRLLATKVGNVYRLTFERKPGSKYVNIIGIEKIP